MPIATKSSKIDISKEIITQKIAEKIASKVSKNTTLLFYGNIGVGKTTFTVSYTHLTLPTTPYV